MRELVVAFHHTGSLVLRSGHQPWQRAPLLTAALRPDLFSQTASRLLCTQASLKFRMPLPPSPECVPPPPTYFLSTGFPPKWLKPLGHLCSPGDGDLSTLEIPLSHNLYEGGAALSGWPRSTGWNSRARGLAVNSSLHVVAGVQGTKEEQRQPGMVARAFSHSRSRGKGNSVAQST